MKWKKLVNYEIPKSDSPESGGGKTARTAWALLAYFLIFMILFSILSRSTSSMTTAKVTVEKPKAGTLEHSVKISGDLFPNQKVAVSTVSGISISKVNVKKGDEVKAGDILLELEPESLKKLFLEKEKAWKDAQYTISDQDAEDALKEMKDERAKKRVEEDYQDQLISDSYSAYSNATSVQDAKEALDNFDWSKYVDDEDFSDFEGIDFSDDNAVTGDATSQLLQAEVDAAQEAIRTAESELYRIPAMLEQIESQFETSFDYNNLSFTTVSGYESAQLWFNSTIRDMAYIAAGYQDPEGTTYTDPVIHDQMISLHDQTIEKIRELSTYQEAEERLEKAKEKYEEANAALEQYLKLLANNQKKSDAEKEAKYQEGLEQYNKLLKAYERACVAYQGQMHSLSSSQRKGLRTIEDANDPVAVKEQQEYDRQYNLDIAQLDYEKIQKVADADGILRAECDGTVLEVKVTEGAKTGEDPCVILGNNKEGYYFEGTLSKEETDYVKLGSTVSISTYYHGDTITLNGVVEDLSVDPDNREQYNLTVMVQNDGEGCASHGEISIQSVSEKYDVLVPNTAIKEEGSGCYVFVIEEEKGILGTTLVAQKVSVTVKEKDENNSAVTGLWDAQVIVRSDRSLKEGDRVRLNES